MSVRLQHQLWLTNPATLAVLDALEAAGGPGCARFVGGAVRNALRGQPVDDLDIATTLKPEQVMAALKVAGLKAVPTGMAHGTVTAVSQRRPYEITTLRRDVETDGRRAVVAFTDDWAEDAARRDFRLNALYADREGTVFDPTGQGVADAVAGRVVFVGDAETRIREDTLRILRFFRFFAWYGQGTPDAAGLEACTVLADGVVGLSAERVSKELLKLLAAPDPRAAVRAMAQAGVLKHWVPEPLDLTLFERMVGISQDPVLRLSALLPSDKDAVAQVASGLRLSNTVRDRLVAMAGDPVALDMSDQQARAATYRNGTAVVLDQLVRAEANAPEQAGDARRLTQLVTAWKVPVMPVGGRDLARLGIEPGPETGRILKAFENGWIADDFPTEGHQARLQALIRAEPPS